MGPLDALFAAVGGFVAAYAITHWLIAPLVYHGIMAMDRLRTWLVARRS